jgi:hypothetical protein
MINRLIKVPKIVHVLFILQATAVSGFGVAVLILLDPEEIGRHPLALESIFIPICSAGILAISLGSLIAIRLKTWREVELMIQTSIMFYAITIITLAARSVAHSATMISWIAIMASLGSVSVWCWIYFLHLKEVRGPGINIKKL